MVSLLQQAVDGLRPELHRYCARLTGSVVDGEDIVQDTLAKALVADLPPAGALRPWLFRVAHNTALDFLKSHGRKYTEPREDIDELAGFAEVPDPLVVRAALARFLGLPLAQRSAVVLKDVLGHSLEETAETMGTTVPAVKAALVRGRARLLAAEADDGSGADDVVNGAVDRSALERYASLFNRRDWDGVRALVGEDCHLDLVGKTHKRGKEVGMYFGQYAALDVSLEVIRLDGALALAAHVGGAPEVAYFVLLGWRDGRVQTIRDFRYVPYIAREAVHAARKVPAVV